MRVLSYEECTHVTGSIHTGSAILAGVSALAGGIALSYITSYFSPLSTFIGTASTGAVFAVVGTLFMPGVGTIIGGGLGALTGYCLGASVANIGAFGVGAIIGGGGVLCLTA